MKTHALLGALLLALPATAGATDVIGNINVDTTWSLANSPYRLTGDVTVASHATLTIEPGVVVQAASSDALGSGTDAGEVELIVRGTLLADGTAASPIVIEGVSSSAGSWYGIVVDIGAGASSITHATIRHAIIGLQSRSVGGLALQGLVVEDNLAGMELRDDGSTGVIYAVSDSIFRRNRGTALTLHDRVTGTISRCELTSNRSNGIKLESGSTATVEATRLIFNGANGIEASSGSALTLQNSVLAGNASAGADLHQAAGRSFSLLNNTIDRNRTDPFNVRGTGAGLLVRNVADAPSFVVRNNLVTNSATGISVLGTTCPSMDHNNVWGNTSNYDSCSAGTGSTSANPLYVQPLQPSGSWSAVSHSIYSGYSSGSWTIDQPGAAVIRVTGANLSATSGYSYSLRLVDRYGEAARYTSNRTGTLAEGVGDRLTIDFTRTSSSYNYSTYSSTGYEWRGLAYNYRLQASSPALDMGNGLSLPTTDADGQPRQYDGNLDGTATVDLGAYEWHENLAPVARAGSDRVVLPNTTVQLDGSLSYDADGSIVAWDWDFGDGSAHATTAATSHTFTTVGTYTVQLTVTDDQGVTGTDSLTVTVANNLPPVASAGTDQYVAPGTQITLDASGSSDADGNIVGYLWNFGDGTPNGSGRVVTHTYGTAGVYLATVTVTDDRGATDSDQIAVVVGGSSGGNLPPQANAGPARTVGVGTAATLDGSLSSDPDGSVVSWSWDFGDGQSNTSGSATVQHTWAAAGIYSVTLTVTDDDGATGSASTLVLVQAAANEVPVADAGGPYTVAAGTALSLDGSGSTDPDGTITSWSWRFGDGTTGTGASPSHTWTTAGTYLLQLTVTDDGGATDEAQALVTVTGSTSPGNLPPVAEAGLPSTVGLGQAVTLDASGSSDADGSIASWAWDFGDGQAAMGSSVQHTYAAAGSYVVRLVVTDDDGATDSDLTLVVVEPPQNNRPVAHAGGPYAAPVGTQIQFDGSGSTDDEGPIASWQWDLGDGTTSDLERPQHVYAATGSYLVRLRVTDADGGTDEDAVLVTIYEEGNLPPVARAGGARSASVGEGVLFDAEASSDPDGSIVSFAWEFGDGSTGTGASITHAYSAAGTYLVRLTVTDDKGAIGQDAAVVTVGAVGNQAPVADAGAHRRASVGEAVLLDASGSFDVDGTIAAYEWDLGDGTTATGATVEHSYDAAGSWLVRLVVTDDAGAMAEDFVLVQVDGEALSNEAPVAVVEGPDAGITGVALGFDGSGSTDADGVIIAWQWDFGDGATASGPTASHAWQQGGSHLVTLTVIDDRGASTTETIAVRINARPVADAGKPRLAVVGEKLTFDAGRSVDPDGEVASFRWSFGDGEEAEGAIVTHAFAAPGFYNVQLEATDAGGATGEALVQVVVTAKQEKPAPAEEGGCASGGASTSAAGLAFAALALLRRRR
ncbi:PKD domain-containing protein [Vulgatibacter sp.]|uniref:PKD domain-containing protein n=1 Tax=Vulgatibacter sp. TaxID=1971226 RepID=UPI003566791F